MGSLRSAYVPFCPLSYVGLRQTGDPQTQPVGTADQEDALGSEYEELDDTGGTGTYKYRFVQVGPDVISGTAATCTIPIGSTLYYVDKYNLVVTDKLTASGASIEKTAGVSQIVMTLGMRSWMQLRGYNPAVRCDATSIVAGNWVQASTTSGMAMIVANGAAAVYPILGRAVANKTGTPPAAEMVLGLGKFGN